LKKIISQWRNEKSKTAESQLIIEMANIGCIVVIICESENSKKNQRRKKRENIGVAGENKISSGKSGVMASVSKLVANGVSEICQLGVKVIIIM
jgi:hypothetical protein